VTGVGLEEHAVLDVVDDDGAVGLVMRDVADGLLPAGRPVSRASISQLLEAVTVMHECMREVEAVGPCTPQDRYLLLSPSVVANFTDDPSPIPKLALVGWEQFFERAPGQVGECVRRLHADVETLTRRLNDYPTPIIHGDLHAGNVAAFEHEIVLLDWGLLTTRAPASVEFAYYFAMRHYHAPSALTSDELVDAWAMAAPRTASSELALALLGSVVMFGWSLALRAASDPAAQDEFEWWMRRAAIGADQL
jgi:hypothetical protein